MIRSFILVKANLRKSKGQTAAIIVLILLAALMLNMWLMLSMDYKKNFDVYHNKLNSGHVTLVVDSDSDEICKYITQLLGNDKNMTSFSLDNSMHMPGLFKYNGGEINSDFIIIKKDTAVSRSVGKIEIVEDSNIKSGIYMPMLYKSDDITIGKTIEISFGINKVSYTVCGFFNSVMAGSHNCAMCGIVLTEDKYSELEEMGYVSKSTLCSVRIKDKSKSQEFEAMLKNNVALRYPDIQTVSNSYILVKQSRYISQMICSGIMSAMAFFILLIVLVVISSNIINYVQKNMKNLGALKAIGYTSKQLIGSILLQFMGLSVVAAVTGVAVSYCLFPFVNTMMVVQTGIPYQIKFLPLPLFITLIILGGAVAITVWLSSFRIKKTEPIVALRNGMRTHNFKYNHIPLENTKAPLNLALAFKSTFSGVKHNITICITMIVLSLVVVFSCLMTKNIIMDMTQCINLIVGEVADSCITVNIEAEDRFLQEMDSNESVQKVYLYNTVEVRHVDGLVLLAIIIDNFQDLNNGDVVFKGRFPKYNNEIAVAAKYAKEKGLEIGDEIIITADGKEAGYIITGFTQTTNNLGKDCLITREGYERLGVMQTLSYYLDLIDGTDINSFNSETKERFGNEIVTVINIDATVRGFSLIYVSLMTVIVITILILSVVIIIFVLYLLIRTMLNNKKRDYGILKALGFTTSQLVLQTALSFMPALVFSTIAGIILCSFIINPLVALFLKGIGIVKCTFIVPVGFIIIAGTGLIIFAFAVVCLLSLRIRKITPKTLLTGE